MEKDYKKLYEDAAEKVAIRFGSNVAQEIFSELYESEDEKLRIQLLNWFKDCGWDSIDGGNLKRVDIITWLEKQDDYNKLVEEIKERKELISKEKEKATSINDKLSLGGRVAMLEELLAFTKEKQDEQKTITQYNYVKFREGDTVQKITGDKDIVTIAEVDIKAEEYKLTNTGFIPFKYEHLWHIVEQNPAWSEEDEKMVECISNIIDTNYAGVYWKRMISWLKSLKDRVQPHWKPTEEQMEALDKVYKTHGADCECRHILLGLLNDLKKL